MWVSTIDTEFYKVKFEPESKILFTQALALTLTLSQMSHGNADAAQR